MTCNQLMTLLQIYRGGLLQDIECGTTDRDYNFLLERGLILEGECTEKGDALVQTLREMADEE